MLKKLKYVTMILKTVTFLFKTTSIYWYTTNQGIQVKWARPERPTGKHLSKQANRQTFKQTGKTLYKLHLTKILKIRFFDHQPITGKNRKPAQCCL